MSGHTPGPWHVVEDDTDTVEIDSARHYVATTHDRANAQADARLIAAAPALLEALEALLNSLCDSDIDDIEDHDLGQGHDASGCVLCMARAAIAAATGQEP